MHDIRAIRENPDAFDAALARRGLPPRSAELIEIDERRRSAITRAEGAQAEQKAASKDAGRARSAGDEAEFERLRALLADKKDQIAALEEEARRADTELTDALMGIPNAPLPDVPQGDGEDDNVELRRWGTPRTFTFRPREHYELGEAMGGMDFETAAKLSGARFMLLSGAIARLHRAIGQFFIDTHVDENGLTEVWTPVLVRDEAMKGTGQLPKFGGDLFFGASNRARSSIMTESLREHVRQKDIDAIGRGKPIAEVVNDILERAPTREDFWLIPTAEVTLTNIVAGHIVDEGYLPRRYTAWTQCFRSEAGSAGKDTAGMLRQHQFEKVEMVSITLPEDSEAELERMTGIAEDLLRRLEIPFRTVVLCTGDMGFAARRTHDIEVWLPGQDRYREISSCSVCGDFQARRMNARFRRDKQKRPEFVHTLNGSGLAVGRTLIAVMENGQQEDGSITIPEVLRSRMAGATRITADGSLD